MFLTIVWLMIIVSVFMVIIVLVQRSKGGGLNQSFASQQQIMGVRKSTDFVEKATWTLAALLFVFSIASVAFEPQATQAAIQDAGLNEILENKSVNTQQAAPSFDAQPAEQELPAAPEQPASEAQEAE
ncbi:MAG: preprotein translocase subunit SecG [Bacteroidales bacterium]|nr:preprotein translocase subunit SecG [Bacteroidales bacterium]MDD7724928.1 preprotein translocase subunit SecG [Bacteroidales bacterium]MDY4174652.1 preprotein translocase subunit SecG [Bacteroidales bacterium]